MIFALARDGFLPPVFAAVHPTHRTPQIAILTQAIAVLVLAVSGTFEPLAILANASALCLYFGCAVAAWRLRVSATSAGTAPDSPLGVIAPVAACAVIAWLLTGLARNELLALGACLAVGSLLYVASRALRPDDGGAAAVARIGAANGRDRG